MKRGIFISYCHANKQLTDSFIENIMKVIPDVKVDRSVSFGNDFNAFEKSIQQNIYKTILVLCTPEYKNRADNAIEDSGVRREVVLYEKYLEDPNQNFVIPIIMKGDSKSSLPNVFKTQICTSYVNLSRIDILDNEFTKLVNVLQGIYPPPLILSELEAAVHYISAPLPLLPADSIARFKQDITRNIIEQCYKAQNTMLNWGHWLNLSHEIKALEKAVKELSSENLLEYPDAIIKLLHYLSKYHETIGNNDKALEMINRAIELAKLDIDNREHKEREIELNYQKGITLHKMKKLDEALNIYLTLIEKPLSPIITFNAAIYLGHIYTIMKNIKEADKWYSYVIEKFAEEVPLYIPPQLYKELERIRNRAINSLNIKSKEHEELLHEYQKKEFISNTIFDELYPPSLALPGRLKKPPVVFNYNKTSLND